MTHYVEMTVTYEGTLSCKALHGPSGTVIETDAPVDNKGRGASFSPTDLLATALATCITTTVNILADRKGWDFRGMKVRVLKEMVMDPYRRVGRLPVEVWMPLNLSEEERIMVEHTAHTCPVYKSINPSIESPLVFHWEQTASSQMPLGKK